MDQIKVYLRQIKRHHFWILCGLVTVVILVTWYMTVGALNKELAANKSTIESSFTTVRGVASTESHPNTQTREQMDALIQRRRQEVKQAWETKWNQQSGGNDDEDILRWPEELKQDFIDEVGKFRPIETTVPFPLPARDNVLRVDLRERYAGLIKGLLPQLAAKIKADWVPDMFGRPGADGEESRRRVIISDGEPGAEGESTAVVRWNPTNQSRLQYDHFDWSQEPGQVPSTLQVLYAQEDLWILTALISIIETTNNDATVHHNASIKEIDFIRIGKSAGGSAGTVERVVAAAAADDSTGTFAGSGRSEPDNSRPFMVGSNRPDGARPVIDPAEGRYVDKNYDPLPADTLRSASESEDPESFYLRVAKRIPVRMRLKVDQRAINRLLIECANSKLTVEVRQIRMNRPSDEMAFSGDEIIRGGSETMSRPMGGYGTTTILDLSGTGGNQRDIGFGEGETRTIDNPFPYDVYLEIYGIVYIYNPVDTSILGGEEDDQSELEDDGLVAAVGSRARGAGGQ